jgi:hypothetical protein
MPAKVIAFDEEARRGLERGMNNLADTVRPAPTWACDHAGMRKG